MEQKLLFMGHDIDNVEDKDARRLLKIAVKILHQALERENKLKKEHDERFLKQIESKINC